MKKITGLILWFVLSSFDNKQKLLFFGNRYSRSSFCLYNDGKFYKTEGAGCTGQFFAWGSWTRNGDTLSLEYSAYNIFSYETLLSKDTNAKFQIVRIVDCYDQPLRFQHLYHNKGYSNLYNQGFIKLEKNNSINYPTPPFDNKEYNNEFISSNSDTITFRWKCNRESIESINGGELFTNDRSKTVKALITDRDVREVNKY